MDAFHNLMQTELPTINDRFGNEVGLSRALYRVAHTVPSTRAHLLPVLRHAAAMWQDELDTFRLASFEDPSITAAVWQDMTILEKYATAKRFAHSALLKSRGLTKDAVHAGMGFMVYHIDKAANKSKFYEALVVPEGSQFRVLKRWGALTDSGETGRVDGGNMDHDPRFLFDSLQQAQRQVKADYATRISHGYTDAFGPEHQTPDGRKLPMGEYPVGLARDAPFGWGSQSVTKCIPALKQFKNLIGLAIEDIKENKKSDIVLGALENAKKALTEVAHADSTMAQKLLTMIGVSLRRVMGSPRFLPDSDGKALAADLYTMERYVEKQLSHCK